MRVLLSGFILAVLGVSGSGCSNEKIVMPTKTVHVDLSKITYTGDLGSSGKATSPEKK